QDPLLVTLPAVVQAAPLVTLPPIQWSVVVASLNVAMAAAWAGFLLPPIEAESLLVPDGTLILSLVSSLNAPLTEFAVRLVYVLSSLPSDAGFVESSLAKATTES